MTALNDEINQTCRWLCQQQQEDGGWGEQGGRYTNDFNTAEAILGLIESGDANFGPGSEPVSDGVEFLLGRQCAEGTDRGCWYREIMAGAGKQERIPDTCRTAVALEALIRSGLPPSHEGVGSAINWLMRVRNNDAGWAFGVGGPTALIPTIRAVAALVEAKVAGWSDDTGVISASTEYLTAQQAPNGAFGSESNLRPAHTVSSVLLLQKIRLRGLPTVADVEGRGLVWLRQHPDPSLRPGEEAFELDPARRRARYYYVHATDALVARAFANSAQKEDLELQLFRDSLTKLKDRMDGEGGFFGYRTYSWASAQALSAMRQTANAGLNAFPVRQPEAKEIAITAYPTRDATLYRRPWTPRMVLGLLVMCALCISLPTILAGLLAGPILAVITLIVSIVILAFVLAILGVLSGGQFTRVIDAVAGRIPGVGPRS